METSIQEEKNKKSVKTLSWALIGFSVFVLLKSFYSFFGYLMISKMQNLPQYLNSPQTIKINLNFYIIQNVIEFLLAIVILISSLFVLKYKRFWKTVLIYGLSISIIYLLVYPVFAFNNFQMIAAGLNDFHSKEFIGAFKTTILIWYYALSVIISVFFIFVIKKFSKNEIKLLFN